jgi:DNA replication and repair protein RecF
LFYQAESFLSCWRHYERALKQRNAVLKEKRSKQELDAWTDEVVKYGLEFDRLRRVYVQELAPVVAALARELLAVSHVALEYQSGWDKNLDFAAVLANSYQDDYRFGHTQAGPHRADLEVKIDGLAVKHFLSRGQQKLLICAMMLAQGMVLGERVSKGLIYLVDDLPSELDLPNKQKLITLLSRQPAQVFITAIDHDEICSLITENSTTPLKMFHVKHGRAGELENVSRET